MANVEHARGILGTARAADTFREEVQECKMVARSREWAGAGWAGGALKRVGGVGERTYCAAGDPQRK